MIWNKRLCSILCLSSVVYLDRLNILKSINNNNNNNNSHLLCITFDVTCGFYPIWIIVNGPKIPFRKSHPKLPTFQTIRWSLVVALSIPTHACISICVFHSWLRFFFWSVPISMHIIRMFKLSIQIASREACEEWSSGFRWFHIILLISIIGYR